MDAYPISCPVCGAPVQVRPGDTAIACDHCGSDLRITSDGEAVPFFHSPSDHDTGRIDVPQIDLTEIHRELSAGRKINAVKLVREQSNLTLKESLEYVEALERGQTPPALPSKAADPSEAWDPDAGLDEVNALIADGKKIEAIKRFRELRDTSLGEAKAAVEALERGERVPAFYTPPGGRPKRTQGPQVDYVPAAKTAGGGCGRAVVGFMLLFMLIFASCGQFIRTTDMHACVVDAVTGNASLQESLGSPITFSSVLWVMGYSSETDFGGNSDRSAAYFVTVSGPREKLFLYVEAFEASSGFYGVRGNPVPNPDDIFLARSGQISECRDTN